MVTLQKSRTVKLKALSLNSRYEQEKCIALVAGASDIYVVSFNNNSSKTTMNFNNRFQSGNIGIGFLGKGSVIDHNTIIAGVINQINGQTVSTSNSSNSLHSKLILLTSSGQVTFSNNVIVSLDEGVLSYTGDNHFHHFVMTPDSLVYVNKSWEIHQVYSNLYGLFQPDFGDNCFFISSSVNSLMTKQKFQLNKFEITTPSAVISLQAIPDYDPTVHGFYLYPEGKKVISPETIIVTVAIDSDNGIIEVAIPSIKTGLYFNFAEKSKVNEVLSDFARNDFSAFGEHESLIREKLEKNVKLVVYC